MKNLIIQLVSSSSPERSIVTNFIISQYERRMKVNPTFLPEIIFAAFLEGTVIATVGLEFCDSQDCPISCENTFVFDWLSLPLPASRITSALYTRWAVTDPSVSNKILHAATVYALSKEKLFGWCELKPTVAKRLGQLGVKLYEITNATINLDAINSSVRNYYETIPQPRLYQMELTQMAHDLQ
ncbi:MAG: hypothetical protein JWL92_18 [Candidatus Nomurabacteria bacterium]|nr:hypothetical protein [Candidatus Nomurabacteria bacterium]